MNITITGHSATTTRSWTFSTTKQSWHDPTSAIITIASTFFPYLVGKIIYSPLRHEENSGREYALEEFSPCAAIQSLQSFLLENGHKPMQRRFVALRARMARLQATLHNASQRLAQLKNPHTRPLTCTDMLSQWQLIVPSTMGSKTRARVDTYQALKTRPK